MRLSFNTWVYSGFPCWVPSYPLDETIRRLARIGYDAIEIGAAAPHAFPAYMTPERRRDIATCLVDNGIRLSSMLPAPGGGPGFNVASADPLERSAAIDQYRQVADLCAEWGGDVLIYVAGWQSFGTSRAQAWDWSRKALDTIARATDLTVCIEPTSADSNLIDSCDDVLTLMDEVDLPNVAAMFDTYHTLYRNEVPTDYVYRLGARLKHIHLADVNREPPGKGVVDYALLVQALRNVGYAGYLTMEIGFNRRAVDPDSVARSAHDYVRSVLQAQGL
jgi:protein FrlC